MIIPDHWLVRGAQSAIFYYISCGPCLTRSYQRRRRKEAARDRKRKEAYLAARPDLYAQPGPSEMNEHWREDFDLGPMPTPRRPRKGTKDSQNRPNTTGTIGSSVRSDGTATPTGVKEPVEAHLVGGLSRRRYRRADEELECLQELREPSDGTTKTPWQADAYKAPPLNEQHPPIVSVLPMRAEDRQWMTAPPPSTAFLNGTIGVAVVDRFDSSTNHGLQLQKASVSSSSTDGHGEHSGTTPKLASAERIGTPTSRPDSAVSTGRRRKRRSHASHVHDSTTSDSDADDEEDNPAYLSAIARPRPAYPSDSRHSRRRAGRPILTSDGTQDSNNISPRTTPRLSAQPSPAPLSLATNSQNVSHRTSPHSEVSIPSPMSSDAENLPSPRLHPTRNKAHTTSGPLPLPSSSTAQDTAASQQQKFLRPVELSKSTRSVKSYSSDTRANKSEAVASTESEADVKDFATHSHDSNGSVNASSLDLDAIIKHWRGLPEKTALEEMWLGPPPKRTGTGTAEKRWSTEF